MSNDLVDLDLSARIEQIMLDEDVGRLPRTYKHQVHVEKTLVDPVASAEARARLSERMRAMTQKIDALTVGWLPPTLQKYCNWQWADVTAQGYRIKVFDMLLYVEVRFDLSVIVCHTEPNKENPGFTQRTNVAFCSHDPLAHVIGVMRPMARSMTSEINRRSQANQFQLLDVKYVSDSAAPVPLKSLDLNDMKNRLKTGQDISDGEFAAVRKALLRYYNKRKAQARARTGRR